MKREIKFRIWDDFSKKMEDLPFGTNMFSYEGNMVDSFDMEKVMQFTGLKDKNGKEIYEGDIVIKFGIDDAPYTVEYGEQSISHDWLGVGFFTKNKGEIGNLFGGNYIEIIGNIYQNPELLKC
jgi:uncharacterized phage protein (TIGR01671 family)